MIIRKMKRTTLTLASVGALACGFCSSVSHAQETLYWTDTSTTWAIGVPETAVSPQWSTTAGGAMDQRWTNGYSAVINASDAQIILAPNDRAVSVDTLAIQGVATLTGSGNNTRILTITGGGSGNLTLATTSASTAVNGSFLRLAGTSAWNGTIATSASAGEADKNRVQIQQVSAVSIATRLRIDGARMELSAGTSNTYTIGELQGLGGALRFGTNAAQTTTLIIDQATNTAYAGGLEKTGSGSAVLVKKGEGTLTLTGSSALDGFQIGAGKLIVDGTLTGTVAVASGATLGGVGSVGAVTLNDGAVLSYSLGVGAQNLAVAGFVKGTDGTYVFDFGGTGAAGETYTLSSVVGGGFDVSNFSAINLAEGVTGVFSLSGSELKFVTTAIPEPSTYALLAGGVLLAGALVMRMRCR
ncbi:anchor protein [Opitutaceae bacterium TAV5]|nr:anchor protein [Opitutaceae bacterium TAV5]